MKKRIVTFLLCLALCITIGGEFLLSLFVVRADAAEGTSTTYSNVLDDLKKDPSFDPADYPDKPDDYSLKVIQIAESEDGSLFLYIYKPSGDSTDIVAKQVNMSDTGTAVGLRNCKLYLVDSDGVFQKYKVDGIKRNNEFVRKYFLVSIYRSFDSKYGDIVSEDSLGVLKAYPVETVWTAVTANDGSVSYSADYSDDVIEFTSSCAGYIYYSHEFMSFAAGVESHYYAFSTNKPIDTILTVYLEYSYHYLYDDRRAIIRVNEEYDDDKEVVIEKGDLLKVPTGNHLFFTDYEYERIQSTAAFLKNEGTDMTEEAKKSISEQDWILRFAETTYVYEPHPYYVIDTDITSISVFRLKYKYDKKVYDVGVIADVIAPDDKTDGYGNFEKQEWWQKIMAVLMLIAIGVLVMLFWGPIKLFLDIIWNGIKFFLSIVLWVFSIPFKIICWLFKPK